MSFSLIIKREAEIDLNEIFVWYEEQQAELGFSFIKEFENAINKIITNPTLYKIIVEDARRIVTKKFPYEIVYRIDLTRNEIRIIAISHLHREPFWYKNRF
jgi:plasmid stabilization system protein ParE